MIRVNLAETAKKRAVAGSSKPGVAIGLIPIVHLLIVAGFLAGGYLWYASLTQQAADLGDQIKVAEARRKELDETIKKDREVEGRKKTLEARRKAVLSVRTNQVSPVVAMDKVAEAIRITAQSGTKQYVWLSRLDQNNATFSMTGVSSSVEAVADFIKNLEATGHFKNITQFNAQDDAGNYNFTLTCEFSPPGRGPAKPGEAN